MVTNYYNASNNFSAPIRREPAPFRPPYAERERLRADHASNETMCKKDAHTHSFSSWFSEIDKDTILILGLALLLVLSDCHDALIFIALGYIIFF